MTDTTAHPLFHRLIETRFGVLHMAATEAALRRLDFDAAAPRGAETPARHAVLDLAQRELDEYFFGERRTFTVPLDLEGTDFQRRVWQALMHIPFGVTRCYAEVARAIGAPAAVRAVGLANSKNPVSIIVPCHRVIGSGGSLTGYAGGLDRKRALLDHEAAAAGLALFASVS